MNVVLLEPDVRRLWAAVRFVAAGSSRSIDTPLRVGSPGTRWQRNRSGLYVLMQRAGEGELPAFEAAFDPLPPVVAESLDATVEDPSGRCLPRRFSIELPRAALPAGAAAERFQPLTVVLDLAPRAPVLATWGVLRLSVTRAGRPAPQAAVRVLRAGTDRLLGRGLSDPRGEALVAATGIEQVTVGDGELVVEREVEVDVIVSFDAAADPTLPIDPDALAVRAGVVRHRIAHTLASGRHESLSVALP